MGRNSGKNPFAGKQRLGSGNKAPKPPKKKKKAKEGDGSGSGSSKKSQRSFWGLVAVGGALAAFWAAAVVQLKKAKEKRLAIDRVTLGGLLRKPVHYTEHAKCRMGCRYISEFQVLETLKAGAINHRKSEPRLRPCAKYVVDGKVGADKGGKKHVQVVCTDCVDSTNIVTVIDKDTDWACYCP